ncbi:MAG TPA: DNA polymerase III subunit delta [Pyrinomonadaceae bacterium]|nr:DNA polymerase III subunit delta [Pyrinomonadaceae bacterium]
MSFSREDLRNQLKRREIGPVYVLYGPETHLRDLAARTIADFVFGEGDLRDFNETCFSLETVGNLERALAASQQIPMMAARRVVKITDIRVSATGYRDTVSEAHEPLLSAYFANPAPRSVVILVADELNGVRKMGKLLQNSGCAVEFRSLDEKEFAAWARREIADAGAQIDDVTLRSLLVQIGPDTLRLTNEIQKLTAAALPDNRITFELIKQLVPSSRELSNFDLTDHLVAGRPREAIKVLEKILDDGAEPLALLGLIASNYRRLLLVKELMSRGVPRNEVASTVKLRYRDQESFLAAARRADLAGLIRAIKRLADADLAIKTSKGGGGPAGARMQLEMLVCELATL